MNLGNDISCVLSKFYDKIFEKTLVKLPVSQFTPSLCAIVSPTFYDMYNKQIITCLEFVIGLLSSNRVFNTRSHMYVI